jgi:predicted membrane protein
MNNLRRDALALFGCIAIIVVALLLLNYGRTNQVSTLLLFGYALDAIIVTGVVGNFIVFLLAKTTRINPRIDPQFRRVATMIGYLLSFIFWYGLHWMWALSKGRPRLAGEGGQ